MRVGLGGISGTNILSIGRGVSVSGGGGWRGPYDAIPSIAALYAMRRALSDYTGPILRLRRDSDNTEQDIGYTSAGDLDTAAIAAFIGADSGFVTTWYDQSGNGNHATQETAAAQPLYVAAGQNSRPVLRFDGSDDALLAASLTVTQPSTMLVAVSVRATAAMNIIDGAALGSRRQSIAHEGSNGDGWRLYAGTQIVSNVVESQSTMRLITAAFNGASSELWRNGTSILSGDAGAFSLIGMSIGDYPGSGGNWDGDASEIVIANAAWSTAQRQAAEQAANNYWQVY